jgi:5-formyltetrahydrofolate cyclo-ligase
MPSRFDLRKEMRHARRNLPIPERHAKARELAARVSDTVLFARSRRIACYLAVGGEMDLASLIRVARTRGKSLYLPVLFPYRHNRLWFAPYDEHTTMAPNRFGILEPRVPRRLLVGPTSLDLVLVPLVAFDQHCNRLGMGGGYYDRTFAYLRHREHWRKPHLLGVAYEFQRVDQLDYEPWDVPLTAVATDQRIHWPD